VELVERPQEVVLVAKPILVPGDHGALAVPTDSERIGHFEPRPM